jgi:hypothetical protein
MSSSFCVPAATRTISSQPVLRGVELAKTEHERRIARFLDELLEDADRFVQAPGFLVTLDQRQRGGEGAPRYLHFDARGHAELDAARDAVLLHQLVASETSDCTTVSR